VLIASIITSEKLVNFYETRQRNISKSSPLIFILTNTVHYVHKLVNILRHVKEHYSYEKTLRRLNSWPLPVVSPASLAVVSAGYFQRALVDESGNITAQDGIAQ
jgi:hypothetical protein